MESMPAARPLAISLFAGGGGLDFGIAKAGFSTRVALEWEKYACETLRQAKAARRIVGGYRYLSECALLEGDVRAFSAEAVLAAGRLEPEEATLLVGGPPCVTFSVAGRRAGLAHETGQLFEDYVRILAHARPAAFIFENVKGMLTALDADGRLGGAFEAICEKLERAGYSLTWRSLDAADYGVPQHRHRVIILGRRDGSPPFRFPAPTYGAPEKLGLLGDAGLLKPWRTVEDALRGLPPAVPCGEEPEVRNHVARKHSPEVIARFAATLPGKREQTFKRDRLEWDRPAKTIRAQGKPKADGSGQKNSSHQSLHPVEPRQITVREAARIQTFPDWYPFDTSFVNGYRVVGDAVPPRLAEVLATSVREQLEEAAVAELLAAPRTVRPPKLAPPPESLAGGSGGRPAAPGLLF